MLKKKKEGEASEPCVKKVRGERNSENISFLWILNLFTILKLWPRKKSISGRKCVDAQLCISAREVSELRDEAG